VVRTAVPADPEPADAPAVLPDDPPPDVSPERAAPLNELGRRLPGTGQRNRRGDEDTDDDLF
jgi:hypothetical protein